MEIRDTVPAEVHRWALVLAIGASALVYGPAGGLDGGSAGKSSAVMLAGLVAALVAAGAAVAGRRAVLPWHPAALLAALFALVIGVHALLSEPTLVAVVGPLGRANGAALYLACVALFLAAAARSEERTWSFLGTAALVVGGVVALSAIDEATVQVGPNWAERPGVAGTLGNANFLAAWTGIVLALTLVLALDDRRSRPHRVAAGVVSLLLAVASGLSGSFQGGYVIAAVLAITGLVWTSERLRPERWRLLAGGVGVAAVAGAVGTVLGVRGAGPLSFLGDSIGVQLRGQYWIAAARMWRDAPFAGVGQGRYIDHYRLVRTPEAARLVDVSSTSDSAHNVPLQLLAEGGLLVGGLHVAVTVAVAAAAVVALRRASGHRRLWVGGLVAAWVGYTLQSLISVDAAPLAVLGWVLGGLVVGAAAGPRTLPLPATVARRRRPVLAGQGVAGVALLVVAVVGLHVATLPYRADVVSSRAVIEPRRTPEGRTATSTAIEFAPWREAYHTQLVRALADQDEVERADGAVREALERHPQSFEAALNAARLALRENDLDLALERYKLARELDPLHPDLAVEMARVAYQAGEPERARTLLEEALEVDPDHEDAQLLLSEL